MPLLRADAELLSNNDLVRGVIETIIDKEEMFSRLPFTKVDGKAYLYNRENTIDEGDWIDPVSDVVPEGAATFSEITTKLRVLAGDVDVDGFLNDTMSDTNSQLVQQIMAKAKGLSRNFKRTLVQGDATVNPKKFDGMNKLVDSSQRILAGANGNALTLSMLDELLDAVRPGADAIIMRPGTLRAHRALLRAQGGSTGDSVVQGEYGLLPAHNGVPILLNEFVLGNVTQGSSTGNTCSVYAVRFNEADGLHGLYGGPSAGIRYEDVGIVQNKDARRSRLKWYCGLALKGTRSLASVDGITNI